MVNSGARAVMIIILVLNLFVGMYRAMSFATMEIAAMATRDAKTGFQSEFICQVV